MEGKYSGSQARIINYSSNSVYILCASHSLNVTGNLASESRNFIFVQKLFTFFSSPTHRWNISYKLLNKCEHNLTIKRVSDIRWSAKGDAVALKIGHNNTKVASSEVSNSNFEKKITVMVAKFVIKKIEQI